jgi:hypothetical protein
MGIRFTCPNGHKLNVKESLAGRRAICPNCGAKLTVPLSSTTPDAMTGPPVGSSPLPHVETPSTMIPVLESGSLPAIAAVDVPTPLSSPRASSFAFDPRGNPVSDTAFAIQRRNRRQKQTKVAIALLFTAIVLLIVLVWVLMYRANQEEAVETAARADILEMRPRIGGTFDAAKWVSNGSGANDHG